MNNEFEIILDYNNEGNYETGFDMEEESRRVLYAALDRYNPFGKCKIGLSLVSEEEIAAVNKEFRDIDKVTDVLSFPGADFEIKGDFGFLSDETDAYFDIYDPEDGSIYLGDIIICFQRAVEQSREYGHSLKRELLFLVAHSILHLIGYDHMQEAEREEMETIQRDILDSLNITRSL